MRVALLATNLARGGAETQVAQLAIRLRRRGHEVNVISLLRPSAWVTELEQAQVGVWAPGLTRAAAAVLRLRPDVLHCHMFHANLLGRAAGTVLPVPVVISTVHSVRETPRHSQRYWPRALAYWLTAPLADRTVSVVSEPVNGVDTAVYRIPGTPPANDRFTWLAAGRLMWKKDYPTLLRAMSQLPEARLWIAGEGPSETALRAQAPPNVEFLGARPDMPELMRSVNGFVLPSVIEGLPVALLEAMASGLPVVATDVGGVAQTRPARLVPPREPESLARAMREVMTSPPCPESIRQPIVERFEWEVVANRWESMYQCLYRGQRTG